MFLSTRNCPFAVGLLAGVVGSSVVTAGEVTLDYDTGVLTITGSTVADRVTVSGTAVRTTVRAGAGTQFAGAETFRERRNRVFNNVNSIVYTGNGGDDSLQVLASVGALNYTGGGGNESLTVATRELGTIAADMDDGDDRVVLQTGVSDMIDLGLGDGANTLAINNSMLASLNVIGGAGPDLMFFTEVTSVPMAGLMLSIMTAGGDDVVGFQNCEVTAPDPMMPAILDGGDNDTEGDSVGQDLSLFTPVPEPTNFEVVIGFDPPPPVQNSSLGRARRR